MSEPVAPSDAQSVEEKIAALQGRGSNAETVNTIATAGHVASTVGSAATMGYGAFAAYGTGGIGAVGCYAAPIAAGVAGVLAGATLANHLALDEKVLDLVGKPKMAQPGPQPAVVGCAIAHNHPFAGALGGLLAGIVVGALAGLAVAAAVGTGGLLAPVLIAAAAGFGGGLAGAIVNGIGSKMATVSGKIITGSPDVFFEGKPVARVSDTVACDKHSPPPQIAEGSETIFINGLPLARIGHKITCSAVVQDGCKTIFADNTTAQYGPVDAEMSVVEQSIVSIAEVGLSVGAIRFRSTKLGKRIFGEPVDPSDGGYVDFRTDFEYPSVMPLAITRVYSGKERIEGLLGSKWICNWSQRLIFDPEKNTVNLEDGDGEILQFPLTSGRELNARHLKAPHYHLTGTRQQALLFDSRTQQTLVFNGSEESPHTAILTALEDRNGNRIDFTYSGNRLRRIDHSDGETFNVKSTPEGCIQSITREGEFIPLVRYTYDESGAMTDMESLFNGEFHYGYTEEGWLHHWRDSGATNVDLEYDGEGRVIATRTPDGMYNDRFIYHPDERKSEYIDATGARSTFWFNKSDLMIREQDPLGNVTEHEWDGLDRKLSTTDALGRVTCFHYDTFGLLTEESDWLGRTTAYKYDKKGLLTQIDHPDGGKSAWEYDERGNLISAMEPDGTTFHFSYDERGRLLSETSPDETTSRWVYDSRGRLSASIDPLGNRTAIEQDTWGRPYTVTDAAGHTTRYHYEMGPDNPRFDLSRVVRHDGGEERFGYDGEGLLSEHTGAEGQVSRYKHGAFDLLRTAIDAKGYITSLEYDGAVRLTQITNASGQKWKYAYDPAGRLVAETDWAGCKTFYHRDALGRVTTKRTPDGTDQHLTWDERDRIISIETSRQRILYEYDESDRLVRAITCAGQNPEPETEIFLSYDEQGRLARETQNGIAIEYQYDKGGRLINRKSPSGETTLAFDPLGLLAEYNSNGHVLTFKRNELGLETERRYGAQGAFALRQGFDPCGRLKSQHAGRLKETPTREYLPPRLSPALELAGQISRRYRWDRSGRLVGVKDSERGTRSYSYDPRDQVTRIRRPAGIKGREPEERYDYDALMNLAQSDGDTHFYEGDIVTRGGKISYTYDTRGRVSTKTVSRQGFRPKTWRYGWDDFDRLTETWTPGGACWRYTYDAFGRRIKKECVHGKTGKKGNVTYLWQGATLTEEWKTSAEDEPVQVSRWHFEPGTFNPIAKETSTFGVGAEKAGEPQFYPIVTDHLGTPKELFDTDGECIWQADHALWGRMSLVWQKTQGGNLQPIADCPLRFQNQWEDDESGLYYNLHRYYDPDSGQYLSQDPIGLEGGLRTHGYVHDPMQWVDPMGLAGCPKAKFVYDAKTKNYRNTQTGKFVSQKDLPYPPNDGFASSTKGPLRKGTLIDRYGKDGRFAGKPGATISQRGLPPGSENLPYNKYEVIKTIPKVEKGPAAAVPDFGADGGKIQYKFDMSLEKLRLAGYIRKIP
jgi:RHS repeat-associated protein